MIPLYPLPAPEPGFSLETPATDYGVPALARMPNQLTRELYLVLNPHLSPDPGLNLMRAALLIFPLTAYRPSPWSLRRFRSLFSHDWACWWGPAASGKTTDAAMFVLIWWLADPGNTYVPCCSTTAQMLDKRIWGELRRLFTLLKTQPGFEKFPAELMTADREIKFTQINADRGQDSKAIIRGVAIQQGTVQEALGNVIGVHQPRVMLVVDEAQASREALIEARTNLAAGTKQFKILLIGNPTSRSDPLGKYSEPSHPDGWKHAEQFDEFTWPYQPPRGGPPQEVKLKRPRHASWETKWGVVLVFCGFDSPGIHDPENFWFLTTAKDVNRTLSERTPDDPLFWTMIVGFMSPDDPSMRLFNPTLFSMKQANYRGTVWSEEPLRVASIDPSFDGEDEFIFRPAKAGMTLERRFVIEFEEAVPVPLRPDRRDKESVEQARARHVASLASSRKLTAAQLVHDSTGSHHAERSMIEASLDDVGIMSLVNNTKASQLPPSLGEPKPAYELYDNLRAEAYYIFWFFLQYGQIRGLNDRDMDQFLEIRQKISAKGLSRDKVLLESKPEMKSRGAKSPDRADSCVMVAYLLRHRFGCIPGAEVMPRLPDVANKVVTSDVFFHRLQAQTGVKARPMANYRRTR